MQPAPTCDDTARGPAYRAERPVDDFRCLRSHLLIFRRNDGRPVRRDAGRGVGRCCVSRPGRPGTS
ncbi:hypothetical protein ACFPM0_32245 [Pseudonocardia sulfidoxydans]|uniref:hypothetical protein n=1 Tax=Pseudonocardia sulfidoxydans TaxID=54011 RepID=UPI0036144D51